MSATDRAAVAQLADGLNRALEGLGRDDAVGLDLSGLMNYDRNAIAGVDLTADAGESHQALGPSRCTSATPDSRSRSRAAGAGGQSVAQTVSEQLSADYKKAPGDAMLNVDNGNYAATRIRDRSTATTLIESTANRVTSVLRKTDEQQLKTVSDFQNHHLTQRQYWPSQRSLTEQLQ